MEENKNIFGIFEEAQQSYADAQRKLAEETSKRVEYFRMQSDGTATLRILPLAPVLDQNGKPLPMERKGYEYPVRENLFKIEGEKKPSYVTIRNAKQAFKNLDCDLIDTYIEVANQRYGDDEDLIKKINSNTFSGGLKWTSKRCMYVFDVNKKEEGLKVLQLSYSQYKDLEDAKMSLWEKLIKKSKDTVQCPISSLSMAYPIEYKRSTENKKVSYKINIDTFDSCDPLTPEDLQQLLDAPRLPDLIYKYTRYHLEATIAFLNQYDEKLDIDVMSDPQIAECIEKIKLLLPADDLSHFSLGGDSKTQNAGTSIENLWATYDSLMESGLDDKTEEGQDLRADIKDFIDKHKLDVRVERKKTNEALLNEIEQEIKALSDKPAKKEPAKKEVIEAEVEEEIDDDEPASPRNTRNDDTNEPAYRPERRRERR